MVSMSTIDIVRRDELQAGYSTPGIVRKKAFESEGIVVSQTHLEGGVVSGWHHHGERHLYGFILSGRLRLEYGQKGSKSVEVGPGDFFHIPPQIVHRDVNPEPRNELVVNNILVGPGPPVINVDDPQ
jgi:uncharacterized RmlC-like cupin family protein